MKPKIKLVLKRRFPRRLWRVSVNCYRKLVRVKYKTLTVLAPENKKYYCPCCNLRLKSFVTGDYLAEDEFYDRKLFENVRQDVLCPSCTSLPRHRILASWCLSHKEALVGKDILYFAPEPGMVRWLISQKIKYTTADLFDEFTDLRLDIQATGLPDDSYDVVICNHVLEHVDNYMTALKEVRRILRPGGILICSVPISPDVELVDEDPSVVTAEERLVRYGQSDHVRLFGIGAGRFMSDAGFEVSTIEGSDYPDEIVPITAPGAYDINRLFVCKKGNGKE